MQGGTLRSSRRRARQRGRVWGPPRRLCLFLRSLIGLLEMIRDFWWRHVVARYHHPNPASTFLLPAFFPSLFLSIYYLSSSLLLFHYPFPDYSFLFYSFFSPLPSPSLSILHPIPSLHNLHPPSYTSQHNTTHTTNPS